MALKYEVFQAGLVSPTAITRRAAPNGDGEIWILDQVGILYSVNSEGGRDEVIDISHRLVQLRPEYDERGSLGVTSWVSGAQKPVTHYALFYSTPQSTSRVESYTYPQVAGKALLEVPTDHPFHNGGNLLYHNSKIYVGVGDGGPQMDPRFRAQNWEDPHGKILELNPHRKLDDPVNIYAAGIRNPWGVSLGVTGNAKGKFFVADVGYEYAEEVNLVSRQFNGGWPYKEGYKYTPWFLKVKKPDEEIDVDSPIYAYLHPQPKKGLISIIGGGQLSDGRYLFGDYSGKVYTIQETGKPQWQNQSWEIKDSWTLPKGYFLKCIYVEGSTAYLGVSKQGGPQGKTGEVWKARV